MNLAKLGIIEKSPQPRVQRSIIHYAHKALLERPRIRALKGNDLNEGLGGVLIQRKQEEFSLRPQPEKETMKIRRRRL